MSGDSSTTTGETRRARRRTATIVEIKRAALDEIETHSPAGLSIRGVARAIGMSPAGLYRYYDGLDALITDLIVDAYSDLADAVTAGTTGPGSLKTRLAAGMLEYRRWSIAHPSRFLLIFGTPIPGYTAPEGGPTVAAVQRIGAAFFAVGAEAWARSELGTVPIPRPATPEEKAFATTVAKGFPAAAVSAFISAWGHFHGLVTLEILGQLAWIYPDAASFYEAEVTRLVAALLVD